MQKCYESTMYAITNEIKMIRFFTIIMFLFFCPKSVLSVEYTDNTILQSKYMKNTEKGVKAIVIKPLF